MIFAKMMKSSIFRVTRVAVPNIRHQFRSLSKQTALSLENVFQIGLMESSKNTPSLTLFLRKDHFLFMADDGKRRLNKLYESYSYSKQAPEFSITSVPFYLPHPIGLIDFKLSSSAMNIPGDIFAHSCFAILLEDKTTCSIPKVIQFVNGLNTSITERTSKNYRCFVDTHIINATNNSTLRRELLSLVPGHDGMRIPERSCIDRLIVTDCDDENIGLSAYPFKFSVEIATDRELGIDDEWDNIREWAQNKA